MGIQFQNNDDNGIANAAINTKVSKGEDDFFSRKNSVKLIDLFHQNAFLQFPCAYRFVLGIPAGGLLMTAALHGTAKRTQLGSADPLNPRH